MGIRFYQLQGFWAIKKKLRLFTLLSNAFKSAFHICISSNFYVVSLCSIALNIAARVRLNSISHPFMLIYLPAQVMFIYFPAYSNILQFVLSILSSLTCTRIYFLCLFLIFSFHCIAQLEMYRSGDLFNNRDVKGPTSAHFLWMLKQVASLVGISTTPVQDVVEGKFAVTVLVKVTCLIITFDWNFSSFPTQISFIFIFILLPIYKYSAHMSTKWDQYKILQAQLWD